MSYKTMLYYKKILNYLYLPYLFIYIFLSVRKTKLILFKSILLYKCRKRKMYFTFWFVKNFLINKILFFIVLYVVLFISYLKDFHITYF